MNLRVRNTVFLLCCLLAAGTVTGRILQRPPLLQPKIFHAADYVAPDFRAVVDRVDAALAQSWSSAKVEPVGRAEELTIARRLSLALHGTIPSLAEIRAFEACAETNRVQWWLSCLLEDRRFSDYLAERLARVVVGVEDGPFIFYRRHRLVSWLGDQLEARRPYDQIVRDLITAEGIWTTKPEANFITVTIDPNAEPKLPDEQKLAARVSRAFLGVRLDCVQCHDDMFGDRWKQKDFHQLAAFFGRSEMSLTGVRDNPAKLYEYRYHGQADKKAVPARVPFSPELLPAEGALRNRLAAWVTHPDNRPFARTTVSRVWALLFNRPMGRAIDQIPLEGELPPGMEALADDLIAHQFDLQRLIRVIAATRAFQLDSRSCDPGHPVTAAQEAHFAAFPLTRLRPEQVARGLLQSANLKPANAQAHVLGRIFRFFQQNDFVKRYGDIGEEEFGQSAGTISQRLIMMNGQLVRERTKEDLVMNAATRVGAVAPDDRTAVEVAYLSTLTRRPTVEESRHFAERLEKNVHLKKPQRMEDLYWTLLNTTEFSWNH